MTTSTQQTRSLGEEQSSESATSTSVLQTIQHPQKGFILRQLAIILGLFRLATKRLLHHPGLSILALIGVILAVGLVTSAGFFAQAVDQVIMWRELSEYSQITNRPPFATRIYSASSEQVPLTLERAELLGQNVAETMTAEVGLPIREQRLQFDSGVMNLQPLPGDTKYGKRSLGKVHLIYIEDVAEHVNITEGQDIDEEGVSIGENSGQLDVWMPAILAEEMGVTIGETFELDTSRSETPFPIRLVGFWQATDSESPFWISNPDQTLSNHLLVRRSGFLENVDPFLGTQGRSVSWLLVFDELEVLPARARDYATGFERGETVILKYLPDARLTAPSVSLDKFVDRQTTLTTLLLGFNIPAFGFLLYFLILTSAIIAYWQRRETAIMVSRGMSRGSILYFTFIEELLLFIIGCPLGLLFGVLIARFMGDTVSFLSFVEREPLPISWHGINIPLTLFTLIVVLLARLIPAAGAAKMTVLEQERDVGRQMKPPFWYRTFLDLLLLIPTAYAYRQLADRGTLAVLVQDRPEDLFSDPLLILVPALFILSTSLIVMRIFPLLMRILDYAAAITPWPALYLTLRQLGRQGHSYINPLLLVIVSLALGVYTMSMAASLDQWLIDRIYYNSGTDISFEPFSETLLSGGNVGNSGTPSSNNVAVGADWIPPSDEFAALPGVNAATRVGDYRAEIQLASGTRSRALKDRFLAVDRVDFPSVAWFRGDFAAESLGSLMNRLALSPDSILVSQQFLTDNHLLIGDQIKIHVIVDAGASVIATFRIAGTYNYFPTVYDDQETIIGNLEYLFSYFGVTMPHNIWLRTETGVVGETVLQAVTTTGIESIKENDARGRIIEEQAKMERVGVFGTLSVSFLAAAVMAALGLLTYSYASLQERIYHFALLNAVGLKRGNIILQVFLEYALLTLYGAVGGVFIGSLAAELFVPLFRITGESGIPLPPLLPVIVQEEIIPLTVAFAVTMIVLELLVIASAIYQRLFQALRLGHQG
ncbi:MAG: FtsX-like permease family protein [Chloroflexota bacterium]